MTPTVIMTKFTHFVESITLDVIASFIVIEVFLIFVVNGLTLFTDNVTAAIIIFLVMIIATPIASIRILHWIIDVIYSE